MWPRKYRRGHSKMYLYELYGAALFWTGMDVLDTSREGKLIEVKKCLDKPLFGE